MRRGKLLSLVVGLSLWGVDAQAQSYTMGTTTRVFSSISTTGTLLTLSNQDDGEGTITVPFAFDFFGTPISTFSTLYASTNGTLSIDASFTEYINEALPSATATGHLIAPMWDDMVFNSGGIYYAVTGSAPSRVLTVEWAGVSGYTATTDTQSFQVKIYENDNIEFHYGTQSIADPTVWGGTVGVESASGVAVSDPCSPTCNATDLPSQMVISFTPNGTPPPMGSDLEPSWISTIPSTVQEGSTMSVDWEVFNNGPSTTPQSTISLFLGTSPTVTTADFEVASDIVSPIAANSTGFGTFSVQIPVGFSGTYYVAAIVDPFDSVAESNEFNNTYSMGSITVTGASGNTITVTTNTLPSGQIGTAYSAQLTQSGATSPSWSIFGGALPPGLNLSSTGALSGTPNTEGSFSFTVQATQSGYTPGTATLMIGVGASGSVQIITTSLDPAQVGVPYAGTVQAVGGVAPYAFQIISGRPDWLLLDSSGTFMGTPDVEGSHELLISVFDSNFADATATLILEVGQPQSLSINTALPAGVTGRPYQHQLVNGGIPPFTINVTSGALPDGMGIDPNGLLAGTSAAAGTFMFGVEVTDGEGASANGDLTLEIGEFMGLEVSTQELTVTMNAEAEFQLNARGGVAPYTWTIIAGGLLPGLVMDGTGKVTGLVDHLDSTMATFQVTDAEGTVADREIPVRSMLFRTPTTGASGRRGNGRGCVCAGDLDTGSSPYGLLLGLVAGLWGLGRVNRRRARGDTSAD